MNKIYLAGPITGLTFGETETWRDSFKKLHIPNIECFSPLRGKSNLCDVGIIKDSYSGAGFKMSSPKAIMTRDSFDVFTASALVVYLKNAKRVSIGTVMEVAWAWQRRIPVVAITEAGNLHDHSMLDEAINWRVDTIEEAGDIIREIFNP